MKFLTKLFLAALFLAPFTASATTSVPWSITNLTDAFIFPNLVNGNPKGILLSKQATVQTPVSGSIAQFVGQDGNPLRITFDTNNNVNTSGTAFMFRNSGGTAASPSASVLNAVLGSLNFRGYGTTGYAAGSTGLMTAKATAAFTDTSMPTAITFDTTPVNSVTATERVRIDSTGNVGIASTSPFAKLSVHANNGGTNTTLFAIGSSTANATTTLFSVSNTGLANIFGGVTSYASSTIGDGTTQGGLTINGWATTTGNLYVAGGIGSGVVNTTAGTVLLPQGGTIDALRGSDNGRVTLTGIITGINTVFTKSGYGAVAATNIGYEIINPQNNILLAVNGNGNLGVSTTTPYARFSIHANPTDPAISTTLFAIGSSTQTGTSTLFSVSNIGNTFNNGNLAIGANASASAFPSTLTLAQGGQTTLRMSTGADSFLINKIDTTGVEFSENYGRIIFSTAASNGGTTFEALRVAQGGNIGVSTSSPFARLSVQANPTDQTFSSTLFAIGSSTANATTTLFSVSNTGAVFAPLAAASSANQTGYWCYDANGQLIRDTVICVAVSARRFKEDIQPIGVGLSELMQLEPIAYKLKPDYNTLFADNPNYNGVQYSLVADDVQKIDPRLVTVETATTTFEGTTYPPGTVHGLASYENWVALFTESIKEQQGEIAALKAPMVQAAQDAQDKWQWLAIGLLVVWNVGLTIRRRK